MDILLITALRRVSDLQRLTHSMLQKIPLKHTKSNSSLLMQFATSIPTFKNKILQIESTKLTLTSPSQKTQEEPSFVTSHVLPATSPRRSCLFLPSPLFSSLLLSSVCRMQVLRDLPWKFFLKRKYYTSKSELFFFPTLFPKLKIPTKAQQKLQLSTPQMHKEPRPRREFFPSSSPNGKKEEQEEDAKSAHN